MTNPYLPQIAPAIGGGLPGFPVRRTGKREVVWSIPGLYLWTVPEDWPTDPAAVVCIAAGGGSDGTQNSIASGGAGALAFKNNVLLSPGQQVLIQVGDCAGPKMSGEPSYFGSLTFCAADGGKAGVASLTPVAGAGGTVLAGDGGGVGGNGAASAANGAATGGATGGYSGNGGSGVANATAGNPGTGGAAGSGSCFNNIAHGSGGVDVFGEGPSGIGGGNTATTAPGTGGSGGQSGRQATTGAGTSTPSGMYGAGGGVVVASLAYPQSGTSGCVRIVAGPDVSFPSTNVGRM